MDKNASRLDRGFGTIATIEGDRHKYAEAETPATR
jgi:hypothetical protein